MDKKIGNMFFKNIVNFLDCEKADCLLTTDPINSRMIYLYLYLYLYLNLNFSFSN